LPINHSGHALESFGDVSLGHHAMQQPVGDVLAADAQRGVLADLRFVDASAFLL